MSDSLPGRKIVNTLKGLQPSSPDVRRWVPSIAASSVIALHEDRFPYWQGDLLIGSLRESLLRARIRSGRVVTLEPVPLRAWRGRIRDLFEDRHGNIVVWFDDGVLAFLEPAAHMPDAIPQNNSVRNQALFNACAGCHTLGDGSTHGIGPDLSGIVNRPIAAKNGYAYSPALAQLSGRWTEENLDRFLADPQAIAPGNTMLFSGLPDREDRGRLIEYPEGIETAHRPLKRRAKPRHSGQRFDAVGSQKTPKIRRKVCDSGD